MSEREVRLSDFLIKKQIEELESKSIKNDQEDDSIPVRVLKGSFGQVEDYESFADFILKSSDNKDKYKFKRTDSKEDFDVKKSEDNNDYFSLNELAGLYNKLNPDTKLQNLYKELSENILNILESKRNIEDIKIKMLNLYKERYPNLSEDDIKNKLLAWY
jgi:hypothetical protein